ncbi:nfkb inhibitor [Raccoonpox virus]|uniref:Early protein OPG038 n=1 Tax=Raccoon poxvirus TaxID=10256 RepID=A0A0G3G488_RACVI|nr:NFkB inhibitor [Raccoonpox virus]AKJ93661.1 NFkB inhibitor [Raccoonpox virus]AOP31292.1 nfkb inhibitor [Raccoonpox virus]
MVYRLFLLFCVISLGYSEYKDTQCPSRSDYRYWYFAAELTIGVNYDIKTIMGECHMYENYTGRDANIGLTGYGLQINMTIYDTDQRFVAAAEGVGEDNKLSVLLFTTQRLDKLQHNISVTITCTEMNCGTTKYDSELTEAMNHETECAITINGSCVKCVDLRMDPININPKFVHPVDKFLYRNSDYASQGSYGVTFKDELNSCFLDIKNVSYDICYRE